MHFFNYLGGALKTAVLLIGLNDSIDKISIEDADHVLQNKIESIERCFQLTVDPELIIQIKSEIFKLSYQGQVAVSIIDKMVTDLEQTIIFGSSCETIKLPKFLKNFRGIYHLRANSQMDGFSCGHRTLANAKAIDLHLNGIEKVNLNMVSSNITQALLNKSKHIQLEPKHINYLAIAKCGLNKWPFSRLRNACKIRNIEIFDDENWRKIADNKLHVVTWFDQGVMPCCFANNESVVVEKSNIIKMALESLISRGYEQFVDSIMKTISVISVNAQKQEKEEIDPSIDWDYLRSLLENLDPEARNNILVLMQDWQDSFINRAELISNIPADYNLREIASELGLEDYTNNDKLLTLINLCWVIASLKDLESINQLTYIEGDLNDLVYFKALTDHFEDLKEKNETGALHFACHIDLGGKNTAHWILISIINLKDKAPILILMDSFNSNLNFDMKIQEDQAIPELLDLIENSDEIDVTKTKIRYILFLYDLFINGNTRERDIRLKIALNQLSQNINEKSLNLEEQQILLACTASLEDLSKSKTDHQELINDKAENDNINYRLVMSGYDACPGRKGKEKQNKNLASARNKQAKRAESI